MLLKLGVQLCRPDITASPGQIVNITDEVLAAQLLEKHEAAEWDEDTDSAVRLSPEPNAKSVVHNQKQKSKLPSTPTKPPIIKQGQQPVRGSTKEDDDKED